MKRVLFPVLPVLVFWGLAGGVSPAGEGAGSSPAVESGAERGRAIRDIVLWAEPAEPAANWREALEDPLVNPWVKIATVQKLGKNRNVEAVPILIRNLLQIPFTQSHEGRMWPCKEALIEIGRPAVEPVRRRMKEAETGDERGELFWILCEVEGGSRALSWLRKTQAESPFLEEKELKELAGMVSWAGKSRGLESPPPGEGRLSRTALAFEEDLPLDERRELLSQMAFSDDPGILRELAANVEVPFLEVGKQTNEDLITSSEWETFPCRAILRKKGEVAVSPILAELASPSDSPPKWYSKEGMKQYLLVRILASIAGVEEAEKALLGLPDGKGRETALKQFQAFQEGR